MRPEARLLVWCARTQVDAKTAASIRALVREDLDWHWLLRMAWQHGTIPLLYGTLQSLCADAVPKAILDELKDYFHANVGRSMVLTQELLQLLKLFEAQGIHAIPLKGPVLAAVAYGNRALRMFNDLDFLVPKEHVQRVYELLVAQGYQCREDPLTPSQMEAYRYFYQEHHFMRRIGSVIVEPHWDLTQRAFAFPFTMSEFWERARPISFGGTTVLTFALEDLLLFLCVHGSIHLWNRLIWICDIAEFLRVAQTIDWVKTMDRARRIGGERALLLGLYLAHDLWGTALPGEILHKAHNEPKVKTLAEQVQDWLFREPSNNSNVPKITMFHIRMRERRRDKVLHIFRMLTTPRAQHFAYLSLPRSFFFLYAFLLPIWQIRKHGPSLLKNILGWHS
jgi:hypothetical protein